MFNQVDYFFIIHYRRIGKKGIWHGCFKPVFSKPFRVLTWFKGLSEGSCRDPHLPWYKGDTLLEAINKFELPQKPTDLPLRLPIQDVYSITGIGVVPVGKVETGVLKVGAKVVAVPGREGKQVPGECKSIEMHHEQYQEAGPGDNVGLSIRGFGKKDVAPGIKSTVLSVYIHRTIPEHL